MIACLDCNMIRPGNSGAVPMQRITITLDDELMADIDDFITQHGYQNRSEAIRDLARAGMLQAHAETSRSRDCVAALVYVYDHNVRELAQHITATNHHHHHISVATMHVHLDHASCMEVSVLRGKVEDVQHLSRHVIAERGVRHGRLVIIPATLTQQEHRHGEGQPHRHEHVRVKHS
jgi:CopG family nickel-responsive transcriptional regulator